jgi:mono/diheme cytochrome c family protein
MRTARTSLWSPMRVVVPAVIALTLAVGVASGCGGGDDEAAPETTATITTDTEVGDGQTASGSQLFSDNCESCHGIEGAGGHIGPNLQTSPVAENLSRVEQQVRNGGGAMPAFSGQLSDAEIAAVAHYVVDELAPKG